MHLPPEAFGEITEADRLGIAEENLAATRCQLDQVTEALNQVRAWLDTYPQVSAEQRDAAHLVGEMRMVVRLREILGFDLSPGDDRKPPATGLCNRRGDHPAHDYRSDTLGSFWCTGRDADRQPGKSERARPRPILSTVEPVAAPYGTDRSLRDPVADVALPEAVA